jgi:hypothetical protein
MGKRLPRHEGSPIMSRAVLVFVCFLPLACGNSEPKVYPVRGEVFFNGQPASGAVVHFHPLDEEQCAPAFATVAEDGSFELSTYTTNDGAEAGEYVVTINWRSQEKVEGETIIGPDRLGERYSKPANSQLKATVTPGENVVPRYNLKEKE